MTEKQKLEALNAMLNSDGWKLVVAPSIITARQGAINRLISSNGATDATEKGYIKALNWILNWPSRAELLMEQFKEGESFPGITDHTNSENDFQK